MIKAEDQQHDIERDENRCFKPDHDVAVIEGLSAAGKVKKPDMQSQGND